MLIACVGISQTSSDTVCLPLTQLKKAVNLIEKGKVMQLELDSTNKALQVAENRLAVKDSIISTFNKKEDVYQSLVANYMKTVSNNERMIGNLEESINLQKKLIKSEKSSKWIYLGAGILFGILIAR